MLEVQHGEMVLSVYHSRTQPQTFNVLFMVQDGASDVLQARLRR